jgi:hypothetical protein
MSTLPFISHHLFVAAAGHLDRTELESARRETADSQPADYSNDIPLEPVRRDDSREFAAMRRLCVQSLSRT